jgi:2-aminoadipate transaminase
VEAIPFTRGVPSGDMLPVDDLRAAIATAMEREPVVALSYSPGGHPGLRAWIGERHGAPAERVICANGSLEAFSFVAGVLLARASTARVLVEAPSYDRSILILQRAGAEVVGIPVDGDGIDTDALSAELEREPVAFLYVIPNFQNPSGATMSLERRRRVLELAEQHELVVVEDDPYGLLRWAGEAPPTLYALDAGERVITLSSFTKTVAPGLRIGYAVAPEGLASAIGTYAENTYISPCMLSQSGLAAYCAAGYFEPGVERAKVELKARCDAMVESVQSHFPPVDMVVPQGGYFLWLDLGPGADTTALSARAAEAGVPFVKGADFFADGGGTTCLRLAFSAVPADRIREGIKRLGGVIASG